MSECSLVEKRESNERHKLSRCFSYVTDETLQIAEIYIFAYSSGMGVLRL